MVRPAAARSLSAPLPVCLPPAPRLHAACRPPGRPAARRLHLLVQRQTRNPKNKPRSYVGNALVVAALASFAAASVADPGTVTPATASAHAALFPLDGVIWQRKHCGTCGLDRPARSKHCSACGRCVSRFDHHCGWVNNCVGLNNTRYFLAFLVANAALTLYGALLTAAIIAGEMKASGLLDATVWIGRLGRRVPVASSPRHLLEWTLVYFNTPCFLLLFLLVAGLLSAAFLAYQLHGIGVGQTTYEAFRWRDLHKAMRREAEAAAAAAAPGAPGAAPPGRLGRLLPRWARRRPHIEMPENIYHRGFWANLRQVLAPGAALAAGADAAAAAAAAARPRAKASSSTGGGKAKQR